MLLEHLFASLIDIMSTLRSVLDEYRSRSLADLPDARIEEDFEEVHLACEQFELERLRLLGELDRRGLYDRDGHLSAASWLASRFKMAWGLAKQQVRTARALEQMPKAQEAFEAGDVSSSAVRVLVDARHSDPEAFRGFEEELVETARIHSINDLRRVAAYWKAAVERQHAVDGEERLREQRKLHASVTLLGMVRVDGDLDPETGEALLTALQAVLDDEVKSGRDADDQRTPNQRRRMLWERSSVSGWIGKTAPSSEASGRTSM
jgi:hypothetical protein